MKKIITTRFILCLLAAAFCFSTPLRADDDDKRHLAKGMTKTQVKKMYGDPDSVTEHSSGATWTYVHDKAKAFLPFAGGPKIIVVTFGKNGKVVEYSVND